MIEACGAAGGSRLTSVYPRYNENHEVIGASGNCICVSADRGEAGYAWDGPGIVPEGNASLKFTLKDPMGCQGTS